MEQTRTSLRGRWWVPLVAVIGFALVIVTLAPRYTDLQVAGTAAAFRAAAADVSDGRNIAAAVADILFAISYVALAIALTRPVFVSRIGFGLICIAATFDLVENTLVAIGVSQGDDVTDGFVDTIRAVGTVKWFGVLSGGLLILVGLFIDRRKAV